MCELRTQSEQKFIRTFKNSHGVECYYCHKTIENKDLTIDHKKPKSRGGLTEEENLAICCESCNQDKADMTEQEYADYLVKKEEIIKNNDTIKMIQNMINSNQNIILKYTESQKLLSSKLREKSEIEKCISDLNFNASEGYMLCKDLKKVLLEVNDTKKESVYLQKIQLVAISQKARLKITYDEVVNEIIKDLRNDMNITRIRMKESA